MDEVSIDEAEANICVDAKELFEGASGISLNGLQYTKAENKFEREKEKRQIFSKPLTNNQFPGIIER